MITELVKHYHNEDDKYGGGLYDSLDVKLLTFYDCCEKVGLQENQYHSAFSVMLKDRAKKFYYTKIKGNAKDFRTMVTMTKAHFDTEENRQLYFAEWRETTLLRVIASNPTKSRLECLELLFDKLEKIQQGLSEGYQMEFSIRDQVISACRGIEECNLALYKPASTFEGVCAELRSAIATANRSRESQSGQFMQVGQESNQQISQENNQEYEEAYDQHWTDRTYGGRGRGNGTGREGYGQRGRNYQTSNGYSGGNGSGYQWAEQGSRGGFHRGRGREREKDSRGNQGFQQKKCYVCNQPGCWSSKHNVEERKEAYNKFRQHTQYTTDQEITPQYFQNFLAQFEGIEGLEDDDEAD